MNRELTLTPYPLTGDVSIPAGNQLSTVRAIQTIPVLAGTPDDLDLLRYNVSTHEWEPDSSIATTAAVGVVKPDGTTITIASDGTISAGTSGGIGRSIITTNSNGSYFTWADGLIEQWGQITLSPTSSNVNTGLITFPTAFTTSVSNLTLTLVGFPRAASSDSASVSASATPGLTTVGVSAKCNVPTGGGGATFDQNVVIMWNAKGI